jgi:arylsulfatase A-like enzyme
MGKTNVLILFSDQQRYDTIHHAGYSHMITPNMDRLASDGCTYVNAHSTVPVFVPARQLADRPIRKGSRVFYER